jgi:LPS export ABC transporter protein LptC
MASWQRKARFVIGLSGLAFAVVVFFAIRTRETPPPPTPVELVDPDAVVQSTGAVLEQIQGVRQDLRVQADHLLSYPDGSTRFVGAVKLSLDDRTGRSFTVTGEQADVAPDQSKVLMRGDLRIEGGDGLSASADEASWGKQDGIIRVPGHVEFERGRLSGSAIGMTYDQDRDMVWLLEEAVLNLPTGESSGEVLSITAGSAAMARRDKYLRLEQDGDRRARLEGGGWVMLADAGTVFFRDEEGEEIEMVELRGGASVTASGEGAGALRSMRSTDMNLRYAPERRALENATLGGGSIIEISSSRPTEPRRIAGEWIDIGLDDNGELSSLTARGRVRLDMPAEDGSKAMVIHAGALVARSNGGPGLRKAALTDGVEFRELTTDGTSRVVNSPGLDLVLDGGLEKLEEAIFSGGAELADGDRRAHAETVRHLPNRQMMELVGRHPRLSAGPAVIDQRATVEAERIQLHLEEERMQADGAVRAVLRPGSEKARRPAMMNDKEPVYASGDRLEYKSTAVFTGDARLWQGETTIRGDRVVLDEDSGDLTATGAVRVTMLLEETNQKTGAVELVRTVATADELRYDDKNRRAVFSKLPAPGASNGKASQSRVKGPQGDLSADTVELFLSESGGALERAEAFGKVVLQVDDRSATGDRLTYLAAEERYTVVGEPVRIVEESRVTTGRTLTFFKSAGRIVVDGNERRTETRKKVPTP